MKKNAVLYIFLAIALCGIGYALYGIYRESHDVQIAEQSSDIFKSYSLAVQLDSGKSEEAFSSFTQKLAEMQKQNSDIIGWIYIPGTHIDYPLLQGQDNSFYLTHAADRSLSPAGSVFIDMNGFADNTLIYGHNMGRSSNVIFHDITNLSDKAWFDKIQNGYIITEDKVIKLDFFAYALTKSGTPFYSSTPDLEYIKQNSLYFRDTYTGGKTFTLSTCAYDYKNARAVLVAEIR